LAPRELNTATALCKSDVSRASDSHTRGSADFELTSICREPVAVLELRGQGGTPYVAIFDQASSSMGHHGLRTIRPEFNRFNSLISHSADSHPGTARVVDFWSNAVAGRTLYRLHRRHLGSRRIRRARDSCRADLVIPKVFPESLRLVSADRRLRELTDACGTTNPGPPGWTSRPGHSKLSICAISDLSRRVR